MFDNNKYLTCGVNSEIPAELQIFMWNCVMELPEPKDYLQVFRLSVTSDGKQKVVHSQEQPKYKKEYIVATFGKPITAKVFVIDDGDHSTMLLAEEY